MSYSLRISHYLTQTTQGSFCDAGYFLHGAPVLGQPPNLTCLRDSDGLVMRLASELRQI